MPSTKTAANTIRLGRWAYWTPWCLMEARKTPDPAATLALLAQRHQSRLSALLAAGISLSALERHDADDPRLPDDAWEFAFHAIVERRRTHMGRVRGQHRHPIPSLQEQEKETRRADLP